jgi:hypothetical protein
LKNKLPGLHTKVDFTDFSVLIVDMSNICPLCPFKACPNYKGATRSDGLRRHVQNVHKVPTLDYVDPAGSTVELLQPTMVVKKKSNGQYGKGESKWFKTTSSLSVDKINGLTEVTVYPNPVKEVAKLNFSLEKASNLTIAVYDQLGQLVQVVSNSQFNAGVNQVEINTSSLNSGIYNIRIDAESGSLSQRISVIK